VSELSSKFQHALALHRRSELENARAVCEQILKIEPRYFDALHLAGVIAAQTGNLSAAVLLIGRAIDVNPSQAAAYCNRGSAFKALNQLEAALADYDWALALDGTLADAYSNRGVVLTELGRFVAALASLDRAIKSRADFAEAYFNRGNVLRLMNRREDALDSYNRALAINARYAAAYFNRGDLLREMSQGEAALESFSQAIAAWPSYAEAYVNRGNVLQELRQPVAALASYDAALRINPNSAEAFSNRGAVLRELGQFVPALASFTQAIAIKPDSAEAHCGKGNVLRELGELDAARASYEKALILKEDFAEAYSNLGVLLTELRQFDAAVASYDRAIALRKDYADARANRAMASLLLGDFEQGWQDYEWRGQQGGRSAVSPTERFSQPVWRGGPPLAGKTILLHCEQGLGDALQFCRYVTAVAELGAIIILEVPRLLASLLYGLEGVSRLIIQGEALPEFDYHCPLMSLPLAFGTTLASIPARVPYLKGSAEQVARWRQITGERTRFRVGLVWSGGFRPDQPALWSVNRRRNIPLAKLAPLRHAGMDFYSLQKGQPAESELAELTAQNWDGPQLIDLTDKLHDFSDTAALIAQLDLVISVDTSTAHLAGALGKPVWILNRFDGCWRWLLNRIDSPWYPTAMLYRQERSGDWDSVVSRVRADLGLLAE